MKIARDSEGKKADRGRQISCWENSKLQLTILYKLYKLMQHNTYEITTQIQSIDSGSVTPGSSTVL